jgi:serine/threonine protein kinase
MPPTSPSSILRPGTVLRRRFVVGHMLAATNLSTVYLGWEQGRRWAERRVVIKRLSLAPNPGGLSREVAIHAFRQEVALLASLHHPQLPRLRAAFQRDDDYYMVMDYVDGITLDAVMDRGPISLALALAIADDLCDVLAYLHRQHSPIIHADIKPSNVMLAAGGRIVLLDLGLARRRDSWQVDDTPIGTLPYAPPEQRRGAPLDERSDLYALGVLLQEILGSAANHPTLRAALYGATAPLPDDRYATVRQFQRTLHGEDAVLSNLHGRIAHGIAELWTIWTVLIVIATFGIMLLPLGPTRHLMPPVIPTPALHVVLPTPTLTPCPAP